MRLPVLAVALVAGIGAPAAAAAPAKFLELPIWAGPLPAPHREMLKLAVALSRPLTIPRFRAGPAYAKWMNGTYGPLARRDQQDRQRLDALAASVSAPADRAFAAVLSAFVRDALFRRDHAVDGADPDAATMASAGIGLDHYAARADQLAEAAARCAAAAKEAGEPFTPWIERCEKLQARYHADTDESCKQAALRGLARSGTFCGDRAQRGTSE